MRSVAVVSGDDYPSRGRTGDGTVDFREEVSPRDSPYGTVHAFELHEKPGAFDASGNVELGTNHFDGVRDGSRRRDVRPLHVIRLFDDSGGLVDLESEDVPARSDEVGRVREDVRSGNRHRGDYEVIFRRMDENRPVVRGEPRTARDERVIRPGGPVVFRNDLQGIAYGPDDATGLADPASRSRDGGRKG